jgi:hypothetical protein
MITRKQIEKEKNFKQLKEIAKVFRNDGHKIALNESEATVRENLLIIFDEHYANIETEEISTSVIEDNSKIEEESMILPVEGTITEEASADPYDNSKLYYTKVSFKDWETGWSFNPATDEPKLLPEILSNGLKNSLKVGRIKRFIQ